MAQNKVTVPVVRGDGIGPEIMNASLHVLMEAGANIEPLYIDMGEKVYLTGSTSGIQEDAWDILRKHKVLYKAPITTPQGGGYKSLNVTIRKTLGLYANVRPAISYHPYIPVKHPGMNLVVIRENEEDLYAGIEHQQTPEVTQCLKLISRPGCEKISRFAFEYAKANDRKKITCMTKDNIMKITDGLFRSVFEEVALEYPEIESEHWIIDIGTAKLADSPEMFDVVLQPNLYGDVTSDMTGQISGSVGISPGANIGDNFAMFEAIHGSAPKHAGKNAANPSAVLLSGVMMLVHLGQADVAEKVHNAWLRTIEDGVGTYDLARKAKAEGKTDYKEVGTKEFADEVIKRLGQKPQHLDAVTYDDSAGVYKSPKLKNVRDIPMELDGVDVFIGDGKISANDLGQKLESLAGPDFKLTMVSNRGQKVYPDGHPETFCTDHWRCRFKEADNGRPTNARIRDLMQRVEDADLNWIKLENLYLMDGKRAYSMGQGE